MVGSVPRLEKWLQQETGDAKLRLRWDNSIERYVVGRLTSYLSMDHVEWFYVCTDGDSGYRPVDSRTVRKIKSLDTWRRDKQLTAKDFCKMVQDKKLDEQEERSEAIRDRLRHESRYIKKAAQRDGIFA